MPKSSFHSLDWVTFLLKYCFWHRIAPRTEPKFCTMQTKALRSSLRGRAPSCSALPRRPHPQPHWSFPECQVLFPQSLSIRVPPVWSARPSLLHVHFLTKPRSQASVPSPQRGLPQSPQAHSAVSLCLLPLQNLPIFKQYWLFFFT